jgi:hypothetical protein
MLRGVERRVAVHWPWLGSAVLVLFVLWCHADYGATWDEGLQDRYGELVLAHFRADSAALGAIDRLEDLRFYSPAVDLALVTIRSLVPGPRFQSRHLWLGLFSVIAFVGLARFVRGFARAELAVFCTLALFLMPRFLGHIHNNSKDVPLVIAVTFYFAALARACLAPRVGWREALSLGLALGFALSVRPGFLPLAVTYGLGAWALRRFCGVGSADGVTAAARARTLGMLSLALALGWTLMVLPWPHTHADPVRRPLGAMFQAFAFPRVYPVLFEGREIPSDALPARYLAQYLAITTPPALSGLAVLGVVRWARGLRSSSPRERFFGALSIFWLVLPVLGFVAFRPNTYDGIRHFLFVLPALAVLAGLGALAVLDGIRATRVRALAWPVALGLTCASIPSLVALHPYQASYFNLAVGGLAGAHGRYDTDYWGSCLRESVRFVNGNSERETRVLLGARTLYPKAAASEDAAPHVQVLAFPEVAADVRESGRGFDYYVAPTRRHMGELFLSAPIVFAVMRDGAPFCIVRDLRTHDSGSARSAPGG